MDKEYSESPAAGSAGQEIDATIIISDEERPVSLTVQEKKAAAPRRSFLQKLKDFFVFSRSVADDSLDVPPLTSPAEEAAALAGEKLNEVSDFYQVAETPFASGGQGRVSTAVDKTLGCGVAVKSLHEHFCGDQAAREAFLNEARLTASLDHPGIIPVHGLFSDSGNGMHLAMKLIDGYTLKTYLADIIGQYESGGIRHFDESKSRRNRIEILLRVCDAISCAHSKNIIHRDLKPENIMIGKHRETYVTDWGIAAKLGEPLPEKLKGTPRYIAPEVLIAKTADVRSDIYSLGIILFELVTLSPAFGECELPVLIDRVKAGMHAPCRHRFGCRIDNDLKAVISKAVERDPAKRYDSVESFAADLRHYLANEEVSANPDGLFSRTARFSTKHFKSVLALVLFVLMLGTGGVAYTLHKQFAGSIEKRYRDNAAGMAYSFTSVTANEMEKGIKNIEYRLETLRMNILFSLLKIKAPYQPEKELILPLDVYAANPPAGYIYAPGYRVKADFDHIGVFNYRKRKLDPEQLKYFENTAKYMQDILFSAAGKFSSESEMKRFLAREGKAVRMIYFALADGLFGIYPGMSDFPENYNAAARGWFIQAEKAGGHPVWSRPYHDVGEHQDLVLTCSLGIIGERGRFFGVAAADFSLSRMAAQMLRVGGRLSPFVREKILVNRNGEVIFRMVTDKGKKQRLLSDKALLTQMVKMKHGTLTADIDGKEVLISFAFVPSLRILFAECLDMETLSASLKKNSGW